MPDVIQLLETLACDPRGMEPPRREEALASMEPAVREALLCGDVGSLGRILGARAVMACIVTAPENDEPVEDSPSDDDEAIDIPEGEGTEAT